MGVSIFGVRHHGPGCARSLRTALEKLQPDLVLVEGPPDAHNVLSLLMAEGMQPPVALLIYAPDAPQRAVYYPFTHFSPEWQALRYALSQNIPARFMDLPQALQLASEPAANAQTDTSNSPDTDIAGQPLARFYVGRGGRSPFYSNAHRRPIRVPCDQVGERPPCAADNQGSRAVSDTTGPETPGLSSLAETATETNPQSTGNETAGSTQEEDPLDLLAKAAGYTDYELWWEREIEQRRDAANLFEGILEAMTALRSDLTPKNEYEARREAHMRQSIRIAMKEGYARIAVICGAWHSPVLGEERLKDKQSTKADAALLSGLKRIKVEATWIPWTNSRLAYRSGYGAGVTSPGWYEHLWTTADRVSIRWVTRAAHLLRSQGLDASSASVIEAVRLAETLAALRGLSMPGLVDLREAIQTVLCHGNIEPMNLVRDRLEIGEKLGEVPPETPAVPLQRDLENLQRRLRLKPSPDPVDLDLDLRKDNDRARSRLLHRLNLLNIPWGTPYRISQRHSTSTFHEFWRLKWEIEFIVKLIEANVWGNTVESAASSFARSSADGAQDLPQLTELLDRVILAELPEAIDHLLNRVQTQAAISADVRHMMDALPALARVARYSDVRETKAEHVLPVIATLFERIVIGLPGACSSLDDDAARAMVESIDRAHSSISLLDNAEQRHEWQRVQRYLVDREGVHGLVRGRCCRLLLEQKAIDEEELQRLARLALAPIVPSAQAAAWIEGVLRGSGLLLLHQDGLWLALDRWLSELAPESFTGLLPLLRRAFSGFEPPERRAMGEKVTGLRSAPLAGTPVSGGNTTKDGSPALNHERAQSVLPVLAQVLGVKYAGN